MRTRFARLLFAAIVVSGCAPKHGLPVATPPATQIVAAPDHFARLQHATLRYRAIGVGDPVILIHGYGDRLETWSGIGDSLGRDHRVVALDLRGFGESTKFTQPSDYGVGMADDVAALIAELRIDRAHIVGHSMGALVAATFANRYPRQTRSVTLISGPFYGDSVAFVRESARWTSDLRDGRGLTAFLLWLFPGLDSATAVQANADAMAHNDRGSLIAVMLSLGAMARPLQEVPAAPVLIAVGGADPLNRYSHTLANQWPRARLLDIPAANHISILSQPELLAEVRQLMRSQ